MVLICELGRLRAQRLGRGSCLRQKDVDTGPGLGELYYESCLAEQSGREFVDARHDGDCGRWIWK